MFFIHSEKSGNVERFTSAPGRFMSSQNHSIAGIYFIFFKTIFKWFNFPIFADNCRAISDECWNRRLFPLKSDGSATIYLPISPNFPGLLCLFEWMNMDEQLELSREMEAKLGDFFVKIAGDSSTGSVRVVKCDADVSLAVAGDMLTSHDCFFSN